MAALAKRKPIPQQRPFGSPYLRDYAPPTTAQPINYSFECARCEIIHNSPVAEPPAGWRIFWADSNPHILCPDCGLKPHLVGVDHA